MRKRWTLLVAMLPIALLGADRPAGLGNVTDVRHWSYDGYTRVVVEFDRPVEIKTDVKRLPPNEEAHLPERIYLDLAGIWVGTDYDDGIDVGDGLLHGVRIGQNTRKDIRVVVDLAHYERHRILRLSHPHRLVVDVYGRRSDDPPEGDGGSPGEMRLPSALRSMQTVVLDPGHGGRDPGAIGVGGIREKEVTLKLAEALAEDLRAEGFNVVLTRKDDRAVSLEERTAIAEAAGGDVFVSLHANAAHRRSARGVETYYLDEDHQRHSLTVAARENGVSRSEVNALQSTIAKLRVSEVSPQSRRLAETVQRHIVEGMRGDFDPVPDLGAKKGPFYVLFLSSMPAILVEAGFLTNQHEAKRLRDPKYVERFAKGILQPPARHLQVLSQLINCNGVA